MATRTISNAGGNYNATGTWVEGIVPTSADDVVATATSGQLTVNVASAAQSFNFTNYTNTLTLNAVWTVSGTGTQIFVNAMTIAGTSNIAITGTGAAITTNGKLIPNLSFTGNKTLNDTLNVANISTAALNINSNTINCSGNWNSSVNSVGGTSIINLIGTASTISFGSYIGSGGININSTGTLSGTSIGIGLGANTTLNYSAGTLFQMRIKQTDTPITINGNGAEFESFDFAVPSTSSAAIINLSSEFKVKYYNAQGYAIGYNPTTTNATQFAGSGALNITSGMNLSSVIINSGGIIQYKPYNIAFNTGVTHSIREINMTGFDGITTNTTTSSAFGAFRSATSGTRANVNILSPTTSIISNTNITDINFSSPIYKLFGGTVSNSTNVVQLNNLTSGGTIAGGYAFTFVN